MNNNIVEQESLISVVMPATGTGTYWFYISKDTGTLTVAKTTGEDIIQDCALIAIVYYNETIDEHILFANEQHGIAWNGNLHKYMHENIGALYTSGLNINGLTEGGSGYSDIDSGYTADEDIDIYSFLQGNAPFWYKDGINGEWNVGEVNTELGMVDVGIMVVWNEWSGLEWQLTETGNNTYVLVHFFRTNDGKYPMVKVIGENTYNTIPDARAGAEVEIASLSLKGLPTPEIVSCYTVIVDHDGNLVTMADDSFYMDWRVSKYTGSAAGGSISDSLHANLTDITTSGHPTKAILYDETVKFTELLDYGLVASSQLIDLRAAQYQTITVDAHINFTFTNPTGPATVYIHIYQGSSGGLVTLPDGEWVDGTPVSNTLGVDGHDLLMVHYDGTGYTYGMMSNLG